MVIDPIIVAAAIAALTGMGGLFLFLLRKFIAGELMPRNTVPREAYDKAIALAASYVKPMNEMAKSMKALASTVHRLVPPNGNGTSHEKR